MRAEGQLLACNGCPGSCSENFPLKHAEFSRHIGFSTCSLSSLLPYHNVHDNQCGECQIEEQEEGGEDEVADEEVGPFHVEHLAQRQEKEWEDNDVANRGDDAHCFLLDKGQRKEVDHHILTAYERHGGGCLRDVERLVAILSRAAKGNPEGHRHGQDEEKIERAKIAVHRVHHSLRDLVDGSRVLRRHVFLRVHCHAQLGGRFLDVAADAHSVEQDEDGGRQQQHTEGVGVVLAFACEVVADEVAGAVEQFDDGVRQCALKADAVHDEVAPEVAPRDAVRGMALAAMRTVRAIVILAAVEAVLRTRGRGNAFAGPIALAYFFFEGHRRNLIYPSSTAAFTTTTSALGRSPLSVSTC